MKKTKVSLLFLLAMFVFGCCSPLLSSCNFDDGPPISHIEPSIEILNGSEAELEVGQTLQLSISVKNLENDVAYESSDVSIASVSNNGLIAALSSGQTSIKAYSDDVFDEISITVVEPIVVVKPTLKITTEGPLTISLYQAVSIYFEVENYDGEIYVSNSNPNVVGVIGQYPSAIMVNGLSYGISTITLLLDDGTKASIDVIVEPDAVSSLAIELSKTEIRVDDIASLRILVTPAEYYSDVKINILEGDDCIEIEGSTIFARKSGTAKIQAECDGFYSNIIEISIFDFNISMTSNSVLVGDHERVSIANYEGQQISNLNWQIDDEEIISLQYSPMGDLYVNGLKEGETSFHLFDDNGFVSNKLQVEVIGGNPYTEISKEEFYSNYTRSTSYTDAMYRTECHLMSGLIEVPDQEPTIATNQPEINGKLIHNSETNYSNKGNTYTVVDSHGNDAFEIYYGAAYTSLEEVAAYIYAWGNVPVNYAEDKYTSPLDSPWGEYLRLNNSQFIGDVDSYPYQPVLPEIYGVDGNLVYYEVDIGTTGTDCDPNYPDELYNDGYEISRGAARIVYSRYYADTWEEVRPEDRYVFYTYNHYNDFQEYLNYENGWGEIFGNITGGGTISSKDPNQCNPTPYVETVRYRLP